MISWGVRGCSSSRMGSISPWDTSEVPTSENGNTMILEICSRFTKLVTALPLKDTAASKVATAFIDLWVAAYGIPDSNLTDNGPQFAAVYIQGVTGLLSIATNKTSPYHPQTNYLVEMYNKTVMRRLRTFSSEHRREWNRYLSLLTTA